TGPAFTYLLTAIGAPSIPGARTPAEVSPLSVEGEIPVVSVPFGGPSVTAGARLETPLPNFNISDVDRRWDMIIEDTLPAYQRLLEENPQGARDLVGSSIPDRIDDQRLQHQWDDILRRLLTDWDLDTRVDVRLGG